MNSPIPAAILNSLEEAGIIAVLVFDDIDHPIPIVAALLAVPFPESRGQ
jgi:hypothetical protein